MKSESVVPFIDAWVGFVGDGFPKKLAQRLPTILRSMFQKIVIRDKESYVLIMFGKAFPELVSIFPVATSPISQDESHER
jgi:hypothetical protein